MVDRRWSGIRSCERLNGWDQYLGRDWLAFARVTVERRVDYMFKLRVGYIERSTEHSLRSLGRY